jgi:hypothetical protein
MEEKADTQNLQQPLLPIPSSGVWIHWSVLGRQRTAHRIASLAQVYLSRMEKNSSGWKADTS